MILWLKEGRIPRFAYYPKAPLVAMAMSFAGCCCSLSAFGLLLPQFSQSLVMLLVNKTSGIGEPFGYELESAQPGWLILSLHLHFHAEASPGKLPSKMLSG